MARRRDSSRGTEWRKRLERFRESGLTVARFCEREGVSTASFYSWRNRLDATRTPGEGEQPGFEPVRLTRAGAATTTDALTRSTALTSAGTPMSIHLPGGVRVEVPMENLDGVRAVVGELMRHGTSSDVGAEGAIADRGGAPC